MRSLIKDKTQIAKLQKNLRFTTFLENAFTAVEENHANVKVADATKSCFHDKINYCKSETISLSIDSIMESFHFFFSGALSKNPLSSCHLCPTGFCRKGLPRDFGSGHHHKVIKCFLPSKSKSTSLKCFFRRACFEAENQMVKCDPKKGKYGSKIKTCEFLQIQQSVCFRKIHGGVPSLQG